MRHHFSKWCGAFVVAALTLVLFPVPGRAQETTVSSRVVDARTGAPIQAVTVEYGDRYTITDLDGRFTLSGVSPDSALTLRRLGYQEIERAISSVGATLSLTPEPVLMESLYVKAERGELLATGTALAVTRVDRESIRSSAGTGLAETLFSAEGVSLSLMGAWGSRPVLRGLGGERIAVLIDGNRVSRACTFGMDQGLATVDPATVERVEILSGPGSALYGSGNLGGVINVVTRRPSGPGTSGELRMSGSTGVPGGGLGLSLAHALGPLSLFGSVDGASYQDYETSLGPVDGSSFRQLTTDAGFTWTPTASQVLTVKGQYYAGRDIGWPMRGGAEIPKETRGSVSADWGWQRAGGLLDGLTARAFFQKLDHHMVMSMIMQAPNGMTMTSTTDATSFSETSGARFQARLLPISGLQVEVGAETTHLLAEATRWTERQMGTMEATELTLRSWPGVRVLDLGSFTQAELSVGSRVTLTGGARLDRVHREADHGDTLDEWIATGNAGLRVAAGNGISLRASLGSGYRTPDPLELYGLALRPDGFVYRGSASLETERSLNAEVGARVTSGGVDASVTLFRNRLDELVVPILTADSVAGRPVREYTNLGDSRLQGISASLSAPLGGGFQTRGSITWTHGEDVASGAALPMIPPVEGGVAVRRDFDSPLRWVEGEWTGAAKQNRVSATAGETAPAAWAVTHLRAGAEVGGTSVTFGVENLFDLLYRAHLDPVTILRPGRNFFIRVSRSF